MKLPPIGFGTSPYRTGQPPLDVGTPVRIALEAGYRLFDTAELYGNESEVGEALRGFPRNELTVIGKLWRTNFGRDDVRRACEASLHRLGIERFDFYLLHAPGDVPLSETWPAMQHLLEDGLTARIGVSNFKIDEVASLAGCSANQIPCWPFDAANIEGHRNRGIVVFGYSPMQNAEHPLSWLSERGVIPITFSTNPQHIRENIAAVNRVSS